MFDTTPQERLALGVLALLLSAGAVVRHLAAPPGSPPTLEYSSESDDTSQSAAVSALRALVEEEVRLERIRASPLAPGERIDPNRAPPEQLARLPRIGPALAERVVAHREERGPFRSADDLLEVPGIGPATLAGIRGHLELGAVPVPVGGADRPGAADRVDINRAGPAELERLPGIGPVLAERIVRYRQEEGPFRAMEDLENVPGIGPALRARLESRVRLGT